MGGWRRPEIAARQLPAPSSPPSLLHHTPIATRAFPFFVPYNCQTTRASILLPGIPASLIVAPGAGHSELAPARFVLLFHCSCFTLRRGLGAPAGHFPVSNPACQLYFLPRPLAENIPTTPLCETPTSTIRSSGSLHRFAVADLHSAVWLPPVGARKAPGFVRPPSRGFHNGRHHGPPCSIDAFPRSALESPHSPRASARLLRFLRAVLPAQVDPHRPACFKPHPVSPAGRAPSSFARPTRDLPGLAQVDKEEALH